ncbi:hypothetical protein V3481_002452 [Fusarium oxysporum f. sp. vasinfectum]
MLPDVMSLMLASAAHSRPHITDFSTWLPFFFNCIPLFSVLRYLLFAQERLCHSTFPGWPPSWQERGRVPTSCSERPFSCLTALSARLLFFNSFLLLNLLAGFLHLGSATPILAKLSPQHRAHQATPL